MVVPPAEPDLNEADLNLQPTQTSYSLIFNLKRFHFQANAIGCQQAMTSCFAYSPELWICTSPAK
jgi:hypothetical protein